MLSRRTIAACGAAVASLALGATSATASAATIHPGVQTRTQGGQCTANFVYSDGANTYLGQAAHCAGTGGSNETNGCTAKSLPLGTDVTIAGASRPGKLAYSSWLTMQEKHETDANACAYNDIGLVKIDPADVANVDPTVPHFGGPNGVSPGVKGGERVSSIGNSELRGGIELLQPKFGTVLGNPGGGWTHEVLTFTPGIPGDSGSGFLDSQGRALGVLSTLQILPVPAVNNVSDLGLMLAYAKQKTGLDVHVVDGAAAPKKKLLGLL